MPRRVTNTQSSTAALTTVKATEGDLLNNLNAFGATLKPSSELIGSTQRSSRSFPLRAWECVGGQMGSSLTWAHTEDLLKVCANTHLLVELGRLGQVGAGFEVRHREDVRSAFTGS